jgi:thioredoxin 2
MRTTTVVCKVCGAKNRVPATAQGTPRCGKCKQALPWVVEAGEADFDELVQATVPVLVDFWAPWCAPCRVVSPAVEKAAAELAGQLKVIKVNVEEAPSLASRYEVRGIPALVIFRSGQPTSRRVGALPERALIDWLRAEVAAAAARPSS